MSVSDPRMMTRDRCTGGTQSAVAERSD